MKNLLKIATVVFYLFVMSCASQKNIEDEEFSVSDSGSSKGSDASLDDFESESTESSKRDDSATQKSEEQISNNSAESNTENKTEGADSKTEKDEFAELENESKPEEQKLADNNQNQDNANTQAKGQDEAALEEELNKVGQEEQQNQQSLADENAQQNPPTEQQPPPPEQVPPADQIPPEVIADSQQQPPTDPPPAEPVLAENPPPAEIVTEAPVSSPAEKPVEITGLKYKANDNGGTIVIEASGPFNFTKRKNEQLNQFVIEVENAILPTKFMRTLNTKDMVGAIGAVDAYQNKDSKIARFVVQLRGTGKDLAIQQEGSSLVVVGEGLISAPVVAERSAEAGSGQTDGMAKNSQDNAAATDLPAETTASAAQMANANQNSGETDAPLQAKNLEDFLSSNQVFTGKKISLEMQAPVIEVIKIITEESGANIIIDDSVNQKGTEKISFKLREVPWDQALVTILKMKGLAYSRVGNVLRITKQEDLAKEQEDLDKLQQARSITSFKVRMFPLSYTKPDDIEKNIQNLLTPADSKGTGYLGKILKDTNTNSVIVTDSESVLEKIGQVIKIFDVAPAQVQIEAKIVEAKEQFARSLGVRWGFTGSPTEVTQNAQGAIVNMTPNGSSQPNFGNGGVGSLGFTIGTLDLFGSLDASLNLGEQENLAKVVASPRVVTLNNREATITQKSTISVILATQGTPTVQGSQRVETVDAPLSLSVTPIVSNDGFITMKINFQKTVLDPQSSAQTLPNRSERTISNNVIVRDGQTTVIGGVFSSSQIDNVDGVPGLKDIPFLGALFRGKSLAKEKNELLIFVTPKVLNRFALKGSSEPYVN